MIIFKV